MPIKMNKGHLCIKDFLKTKIKDIKKKQKFWKMKEKPIYNTFYIFE